MPRPQTRHLDTEVPGDAGNLIVVSTHDDACQTTARSSGVGCVREQRTACERSEILARNPLRPAARRNDSQDVQYWIRFCTLKVVRARTSAILTPA